MVATYFLSKRPYEFPVIQIASKPESFHIPMHSHGNQETSSPAGNHAGNVMETIQLLLGGDGNLSGNALETSGFQTSQHLETSK
jgi:hypothetical protein